MLHIDIEDVIEENKNFREVLHTGNYLQLIMMSIPAGGDMGETVQAYTDQLAVIVDGEGDAVIEDDVRRVVEDEIIIIPAGTKHNFINPGAEPLKLYLVSAPPLLPSGAIQESKMEAEAEEELNA